MESGLNQGSKETQHAGESTILELGIAYLDEISLTLSPEAKMPIIQAMSSYLGQQSTYEQAQQVFMSIIGRCEPLDKLREIVEQPDDPPNHSSNSSPSDNLSDDEQLLSNGFLSSSARKKTRSWTPQEDTRLLGGIYRFGADNWTTISVYVGNGRTRAQCCQRWTRGLNPRISKSLWSYEEDMKLVHLVHTYGDKSWTRIASMMGNRSDVQCRYHYHQVMRDMPPLLKKMMTSNPAAFACDNGFGSFMTTNPLFQSPTSTQNSKTAEFLNVAPPSRDQSRIQNGTENSIYNTSPTEGQMSLRYSLPQIGIDSFDGIMTDNNVSNNVSINATNLININSAFLDGPDNVGYNIASLRAVVSQPMFLDSEEMVHTQQMLAPPPPQKIIPNTNIASFATDSNLHAAPIPETVINPMTNSFSLPSRVPIFQPLNPLQPTQVPQQIQPVHFASRLPSSPNIELSDNDSVLRSAEFLQPPNPNSFAQMSNVSFSQPMDIQENPKQRRSSHSPSPPVKMKFPSPTTMLEKVFSNTDNIESFLNNFK